MAATTALPTLLYPVRWPHRIVQSSPLTLRRESTGYTGFEPVFSAVTGQRPKPLDQYPNDSGWIRTNDRLLRRQLLYPAELRNLGTLTL